MFEILFLIIGLLAGFVSGFAGGGAGLFVTPLLLFFGIPPHSALATARVGALGLTLGALTRFFKSGAIIWNLIIPLTLLSVPAVFVGTYIIISIPQVYVEKLIGVILIVSSVIIVRKPKKKISEVPTKLTSSTYVIFFLARVAQAAFGSGVGMLVNVVYVKFMHMSLTQANATKRIPGAVTTLISLAIFGYEGLINYKIGGLLFAGTLIGSFVGAHYALSLNQKYISVAFSLLALIFGIILLV